MKNQHHASKIAKNPRAKANHKLVGSTLFLNPQTPEPEWQALISEGKFFEVYVPLNTDIPVEEALKFAGKIRDAIISQHAIADPVVVGPVTGDIIENKKNEELIQKGGLSITATDVRAYEQRALARVKRHEASQGR